MVARRRNKSPPVETFRMSPGVQTRGLCVLESRLPVLSSTACEAHSHFLPTSCTYLFQIYTSQPALVDRCKSGMSENNSPVADRETSSTSCYRQRTLLHGLNDPLDIMKGQYISDASISVALFACSYSNTIDTGCVRAVVWPCSSSA
jgi:hypothetical protein